MTPLQKNIIHDKYLGSLLGAIIGDAIGWPQEDRSMKVGKRLIKPQKTFQKWERKNGGGNILILKRLTKANTVMIAN
ncbi:hypothetical protein [Priestia aryabhattai]|uniref:hypothetical protein n=1 Tax=Priestia aryabhattai TaxID=412384 RepID=UPI002452B1C4|nr:hypothetical protein [Priestia aryabhattai]MDH3129860.1 hypothetical protein [Priestia aryabhattai]